MEVFFEGEFDGILFREYNDKYYLSAGREYEDKNGETKRIPKFCQPETGYKKFSDKSVPQGVRFDTFEDFEDFVRAVKNAYAGQPTAEKDAEDIPF